MVSRSRVVPRLVAAGLIGSLALAACGKKAADNASAGAEGENVASAAAAPPDCPARFDIPAAAPGAPDGVVGDLRIGTQLDTAILFIRCRDKTVPYQTEDLGRGFSIAGDQNAIRQTTRVTNGTRGTQSLDAIMRAEQARRDGERAPDPFSDVSDDWTLFALGPKGQERLDGIWHKQTYTEGKMPAAAEAGRALVAKYGEPSQLRESAGGAEMVWMYDIYGRKLTEQSPDFLTCASSLEAEFGQMSTSAQCGLTIRARVAKASTNELLASSIAVGMLNPAKAAADIAALERQLKAADDARKQRELNAAGANRPAVQL